MDYPENTPQPENEPTQEFVSARARRRRALRRAYFPTDEGERAALYTHLAKRAFPSDELFIFALVAGAIMGLGYFFNSQSLERGSGAYYNLKTYERFFFPQLKKLVDAFAKEGFITVMHMDTDWTKNLPYLKELPKHKVICELDSTTNIFKAKEILKDHMCIMGDVPAAMLSFGTPDEVKAYSEKLIDIVGKDGGFILSTGCECPVDAKFENMKALCDTAKVHPAVYTN